MSSLQAYLEANYGDASASKKKKGKASSKAKALSYSNYAKIIDDEEFESKQIKEKNRIPKQAIEEPSSKFVQNTWNTVTGEINNIERQADKVLEFEFEAENTDDLPKIEEGAELLSQAKLNKLKDVERKRELAEAKAVEERDNKNAERIQQELEKVDNMLASNNSKRKYGLVAADEMQKDMELQKQLKVHRHNLKISQEDASHNSRSKTIYRDPKTGKIIDVEAEKQKLELQKQKDLQRKMKEKEWAKGLVQRREILEQRRQMESSNSSSFALYKDDKSVVMQNRSKEIWDDPLNDFKKEYSSSKKNKTLVYPEYKGPDPPPNRFGIKPGYRWDGVDRSNGFEQKMLLANTNASANKINRYLHGIRDW